MRELKTKDIFAFCRVVKVIGIKEELKNVCMKANNMQDIYESGFEIMYGLFDKATEEKAEKALYDFFAGIFEEPAEDLAESDPVEFIEKLMQAAEPEKWKAFFSQVASLIAKS